MQNNNKGIALILVISILAVAGIMAVSFAFTMQLELKSASNFLEARRASYLAQAGVSYAQSVLKEDPNDVDSLEDSWHTVFTGTDVDNDGDGDKDSKWINVTDGTEEVIGRYAVLVKDENGLLNINTATKQNNSPLKTTQGWAPYELDLKKFLSYFDVGDADRVYQDILGFRYGGDGVPGELGIDDNNNQRILDNDGIDNNADGVIDEAGEGIDEPMEFSSDMPFGDDRPFETPFEITKIKSIPKEIIPKLYSEITTYSIDRNVDVTGSLRRDVNRIDAQSLLNILQDAGVGDPFQKAVNITDACDEDFSQSVVSKMYNRLSAINRGPLGDWIWKNEHYETDVRNGRPLTITWWNLPLGEYYIGVFGLKDQVVGDVTVNGKIQHRVLNGDILNFGAIEFENRVLSLSITNASENTICYFTHLELYPKVGQKNFSSMEIRGVEGIRINEVMVKPSMKFEVPNEENPGGDWAWQGQFYQNSEPNGGNNGEGTWTWKNVPNGKYYAKLYAGVTAQAVGDVEINNIVSENLMDGELFGNGKIITVSNGKITVSIQNNLMSGPVSFKTIELLQEPDCEYVELINLTPKEVNISGWSVNGPGKEGWPATIPLGTIIGPHEHLALCVDKDDSQEGIDGNGLSFSSVWGRQKSASLHFLRAVTAYSDLFSDTAMEGGNFIMLKDSMGHVVDKSEYFFNNVTGYKSLEKSDPSYIEDSNSNGAPDNWYPSEAEKGGTPGLPNDNEGMIEKISEEETIEHYDTEVNVRNKNFASIGDAAFVPVGVNDWAEVPVSDLCRIADKFTVFGIRFEAEGHIVKGEEGGWRLVQKASPFTDSCESGKEDETGTWRWETKDGIQNGYYTLKVYGEEEEAISISVLLTDGTWTDFTPPLTPCADKGVLFGEIEIGTGSSIAAPGGVLELKVKNCSKTGAAHFDYITLEPLNAVAGRININTASKKVLSVLPGVDETIAENIIKNRVFGNKDDLNFGIGDLVYKDALGANEAEKKALFKKIANLVTVRSDYYRIIVTAQILEKGRVLSEKKVWAVFGR